MNDSALPKAVDPLSPDGGLSAEFREAVTRLGDETLPRFLNSWADPEPQPFALYHFTDCAGLVGILKEGSLWASLATVLNDTSETTYAMGVLREELKGAGIKATNLNPELLDDFSQPAQFRTDMRTFVASFCGGATASHWLHYGRSGTGVAIAFEAMQLWQVGGFVLQQVLYRREDQRRLIEGVIRLVDEVAGQFDHHPVSDRALAELAVSYLRLQAGRIKNPAFVAENEWRLIATTRWSGSVVPRAGDLETHFRVVNGRVVPYLKIPIPRTAIKAIELGAACPMDDDDQGLRVLVEDHQESQVNVFRSDVSVRP